MKAVANKGLNIFSEIKSNLSAGILPNAISMKALIWSDSLLKAMSDVIQREKNREEFEPHKEAYFKQLVKDWLLFGLILNIVLAVSLAVFFNQATTRRLFVVLENLKRFSKGDVLLPPMTGKDEIGILDKVFRDMSHVLKEARHKEQTVIENANDVICSIDIRLILKAVNSASLQNLGYLAEELIDSEIYNLLVDEDKTEWTKRFIEIVNTKGSGKFESRLIHKTGKLIDVWWSLRWSESEQCMFCIIQDNSERKEAERIKQETLNMVSHDLRSPLISIQFSLNKFGSGIHGHLSEEASRDIAIAKKNVNQLMRLINYLLDLEKFASGKLKVKLVQISVDYMVNRAMESLQSSGPRESYCTALYTEGTFISGRS